MKPKTMILMVVAVTCGLGASYMTSRLLAERETPEVPKVEFLVAVKTLNQGDTIKKPEEMFIKKSVPEGEEPKGAIMNLELLKNRIVIRSRRAGDPIFQDDLLDPEKGYGPQGTMPEGYRGYGIRVSAENIAGGWASLPNSRVDIISTVRGASHKDSFSMIILHDILVLAADTATTSEAGKALLAATVTVAVKPEDVLKLAMAKEYGPLSLVVRRFNDKSRSDVDKTTFDVVINGSAPAKGEIETGPVEKPPVLTKVEPKIEPKIEQPPQKVEIVADAKPVRTTHRVTVMHGNRITYQDFVLDEDGNIVQYSGPANTEPQVPMPTPPAPQGKGGP